MGMQSCGSQYQRIHLFSFIMFFCNAFNSTECGHMLTLVSKETQLFFKYMWQSYFKSSLLVYHDPIILSEDDVQLGDPMGPLAFYLTIYPLVSEVRIQRVVLSSWDSWGLLHGST